MDCSCYWKTHYLKLEVERGLNPHTIKGDAFQNLGEWLRVPRVGFKLPTLEQAIPKFLVSCVTCAYWADFGKSPHKNKIEMNMCLTQARAATVFSQTAKASTAVTALSALSLQISDVCSCLKVWPHPSNLKCAGWICMRNIWVCSDCAHICLWAFAQCIAQFRPNSESTHVNLLDLNQSLSQQPHQENWGNSFWRLFPEENWRLSVQNQWPGPCQPLEAVLKCNFWRPVRHAQAQGNSEFAAVTGTNCWQQHSHSCYADSVWKSKRLLWFVIVCSDDNFLPLTGCLLRFQL